MRRQTAEEGGLEWTVLCGETASTLDGTLGVLRRYGTPVSAVRVIEPTLDDVFLDVTGRSFE